MKCPLSWGPRDLPKQWFSVPRPERLPEGEAQGQSPGPRDAKSMLWQISRSEGGSRLLSFFPVYFESCQCLIWIVCTNIRVQFKLKLNDVEESFLKSLPDISFRTPGNRLGGINCQWQDDSKLWLSFVKFQSQVDIRTLMAWSGWELSGAVKTINYVEWNGIANLFLWQRWENSVERNF